MTLLPFLVLHSTGQHGCPPDLKGLYNNDPSSDVPTIEHYYHFDIFSETIYFAMIELNIRSNDISVELLSFSAILDPKNSF